MINTTNSTALMPWLDAVRAALHSFLVPTRAWQQRPSRVRDETIVDSVTTSADHHELSTTRTVFQALAECVIHVVTGVVLFLMILAPAIGIHAMIQWMAANDMVPPMLLTMLKGVNYTLVCVDSLLFLIFMLRVTIRTLIRM